MKKTKIVATLGPATADKEVLKQMILDGLNVCRLNCSHGSQLGEFPVSFETVVDLVC